MKRHFLLFIIIFLTFPITSFSQEGNEKIYATFGEFLTEQTDKISLLENELNIDQVKDIMGPSIIVSIPEVGEMKALSQPFKQPEFINEFKQNPEKPVLILWYFSTPIDKDGVISKNECTPILFENGKVKGKGWSFYTSYRRANRLMR